jgi:HNH endonuclease
MVFKDWLLYLGKSERTAASYANAISGVISDWARDAGLIDGNLTDISESLQFDSIRIAVIEIPIFQQRNNVGNSMYSVALNQYAAFLADLGNHQLYEDVDAILSDETLTGTERSSQIVTRIGQGAFRADLIEYWNGCSLTGYSDTRLLVASHIKPWRFAIGGERLDPYNGLLLLPNLDKVFDKGLIKFETTGQIVISNEIETPEILGLQTDMSVNLADNHQNYMDYHRDHVFL